jgi:LexA-binding, inner membrane-associated putative hydrolase
MASFAGHISFSSALGVAYGIAGAYYWQLDWGPALLGAGLTTIGGMLPDLDSDSGVPVREMFGLGAVLVPFLLLRRLMNLELTFEQLIVVMAGIYLFVRYGLSEIFKRITVHRGIFHSIPAMLIAGLTIFILYHSPDVSLRIYLALGTMIGFLSHLVLDELYSVDFSGASLRLNQFAGSALKLYSQSWPVTVSAYLLLACLTFVARQEITHPNESGRPGRQLLNIRSGLRALLHQNTK